MTNVPRPKFVDQLVTEAAEAGIELIEVNGNRGEYRLDCGCVQTLYHSSVRARTFRCKQHGKKKYRDEAAAHGAELIGSGSRAGSYTYRLACGCVKEARLVEMRNGYVVCNKHDLETDLLQTYAEKSWAHTRGEATTVDPVPLVMSECMINKLKKHPVTVDAVIERRDATIADLKRQLEKAEDELRAFGQANWELEKRIREVQAQPVEVIVGGDFAQAIQACFSSNLAGGEYVPFYDVCKLFEVKTTDMGYALKSAGFFASARTISQKGLNNGFKYMTFENDSFVQIGVLTSNLAGGEYVPFYDVCKLFEVKTTDMGYALKSAGFFASARTISQKGLNNGFKYMTFENDSFVQIGVNLNAIAIMDSVITKYLKRMEKRAA